MQSGQPVDWKEVSDRQAVLVCAIGEEFVEQALIRERSITDAMAADFLPGIKIEGVTHVSSPT